MVALLLYEVGDGEEDVPLCDLERERGDRHGGCDVARTKKRKLPAPSLDLEPTTRHFATFRPGSPSPTSRISPRPPPLLRKRPLLSAPAPPSAASQRDLFRAQRSDLSSRSRHSQGTRLANPCLSRWARGESLALTAPLRRSRHDGDHRLARKRNSRPNPVAPPPSPTGSTTFDCLSPCLSSLVWSRPAFALQPLRARRRRYGPGMD